MEGFRGVQTGVDGINGGNVMNRAEKFEDEKRRIIDSCFSKRGEDGALQESYIAHIRIVEDAAYPSSPPPPNSKPELKKPRVIVVAVRKSGSVRIHKARENLNRTFSIGKTWPLDDLSAIESFTGAPPTTMEEEQRKQWAGDNGFIVTVGKPYYWQANTSKEKGFFVASLVKIYAKYTGGKTPLLIGFNDKETEALLAGTISKGRPQPLNSQNPTPAQPAPSSTPPFGESQTRYQRQPPPRDLGTQPTNQDSPLRQQIQPRPPPGASSSFTSQTQRSNVQPKREESPSNSIDFSSVTPQQSQTNLQRVAGGNQSQESFGRGDDGSSLPPRSRGGVNGLPSAPGRFQDRSATPTSLRTMTPDSNVGNGNDALDDIPPVPAPLTLPPERRRPPMSASPEVIRTGRSNSNDDMIPAPLSSPGMRREEARQQIRNNNRPQTPSLERQSEASGNQANNDLNVAGKPSKMDLPQNIPSPKRTKSPEKTTSVPEAIPSEESSSTPTEPFPQTPDDERPGLGPMIKKKKSRADVANGFRKAAAAANAFKPRAGGAAERLREQQTKPSDGPDGITSVVPAPSLVHAASTENSRVATPDPMIREKSAAVKIGENIPEVKITVSEPDRPSSVEGPIKSTSDTAVPEKVKSRDARRQKRTSELTQKHLGSLGVDWNMLDGRGAEFASLLDEFGWSGDGIRSRNIDQMRDDIDRELNNAQAGGWLTRLEEEDEKVEAIKKGIDLCIAECDELDGLLTLYSVELGTLSEDIAYIEAQSQGLQVQAANQKLLQTELKSLLETISISKSQLQSLREASLESPSGLEQVESSLVLLFKAMVTIDPSLSLSAPHASEDGNVSSAKLSGIGNSEIGNMRVLQEKKDVYRNESIQFLRRLKPFLQVKFGAAIDETKKALERDNEGSLSRLIGKTKLEPRHHDLARNMLWRYSPLMLFSREVDRTEWEEMIKTYENICKPVYQEEFRAAVQSWKKNARKPTGDESEILFTSQIEKQTEGLASTTARKLTVKRSGTLGKVLRSPIGDTGSKATVDKIQDGRLQHYEIFGGAVDEMIPLIIMEQNFIVQFFHASSLEHRDFPDAVNAAAPEARRGGDLRKPKPMDPNRDLAKKVVQSMEDLYSFFPAETQSMIEWAVQADPLQGVGVIAIIERKLLEVEESSQEYLARTLQKLHSRLAGLFAKFLDEQIRAIEDTKVKINKRKGVIAFIRIFPSFSTALETMLVSAEELEIRETVNNAYVRIHKTMFESLKVIARENPNATASGAAMGDPEDKEALNYQILLIENMNHYIEEVDTRKNPVLEEWKERAAQELDEHLSLYLGAVVRRPLGKLLDFLESTESQLLSLPPDSSPSTIAERASHSRTTFKRLLAGYDSKEIRRGIETLKKRVEKHFGDADDPGLSRGLVAKVLDACEKYYENVEKRVAAISTDIYDGDAAIEWTRADVNSSFRK